MDFLNLRETIQKNIWLKIAGFKEDKDLSFQKSLQLMDCGFRCDDKCNGCKICTEICLVNNIKIVKVRPVWQHHCQQCFACLQWCPEEVIQFGVGTVGGKRYHHPGVNISHMIICNGEKGSVYSYE